MSDFKLTLVMPVWNSLSRLEISGLNETLSEALNSLAEQTFLDYNLLILDNQSTDGTYEYLLERALLDSRIIVIRDSRQRFPEEAIQKLIEMSETDYVAIVNDDDLWDQEYFRILVNTMEENPNLALAYSDARSITPNNRKGPKLANRTMLSLRMSPDMFNVNAQLFFRYRDVIPTMFGVFRRSSFIRCLPLAAFDELKANVDNRFMLRFYLLGLEAMFVDQTLFYYRERPRHVGGFQTRTDDTGDYELNNLMAQYVTHQMNFYECAVSEVGKSYQNRIEKVTFMASTLFHISNLIKWIKDDYARTGKQEELANVLLRNLQGKKEIWNENSSVVSIEEWQYMNTSSLINTEISWNRLTQPYLDILDYLLATFETRLGSSSTSFYNLRASILKAKATLSFASIKNTTARLSEMKTRPQVCVVTCSLNLDRFIGFTLKSIASQQNITVENLIAEGGSSDSSLREIGKFDTAKIVSFADNGFIDGAWKAIAMTQAAYITQCCISDGYANSFWLETAVQVLESDPNVSLVWGFPQYILEDDELGEVSFPQFHFSKIPQREEMYLYWLKTGFFFPEGNFVARADVYRTCLPKPEDARETEPFLEFTLRFHQMGYLAVGVPVVANYGRQHSGQLSQVLQDSGTMAAMHRRYERGIRRERQFVRKKRSKTFINVHKQEVALVRIRRSDLRADLNRTIRKVVHVATSLLPPTWIELIKLVVRRARSCF